MYYDTDENGDFDLSPDLPEPPPPPIPVGAPKPKRTRKVKSADDVAKVIFDPDVIQEVEDTTPIEWDGSIPAPPKPWMEHNEWLLITSLDDLKNWWESVKADKANHVPSIQDLLDGNGHVHPKIGFDLETTGLDTRVVLGQCKTKIVGVCLSAYKENGEGYNSVLSPDYDSRSYVTVKQCTGLYIPIAHKRWPYNLNLDDVVAILDEIFQTAIVVTANGKYDFYALKANGKLVKRQVPHYNWVETIFERQTITFPIYPMLEDVQSMLFQIDCDRTTRGGYGLKASSMEFLGQEMIEFEDITSTGVKKKGSRKMILNTFDTVAPFLALHYAAADAICTLQLSDVLGFIKERNPFIHQLDTNVVTFQGWCEEQRPLIDREFLQDEDRFLDLKLEHTLNQIQTIAGFALNPDSTKILGQTLFEKMGLPNKGKTPPSTMFPLGNWKTDKASMEELAREHPQHSIFHLIVLYRELRSATPKKLFDNSEPLDSTAKMSYSATRTPSGRFACSGGEYVKDGGSGVNVQAIQALYACKYTSVNLLDTLALQGVDGLSSSSIFDPDLKVWLDMHVRAIDNPADYPDTEGITKKLKALNADTPDDEIKGLAKDEVKRQIEQLTQDGFTVLKEGVKVSSLKDNPTVSGNHLKLTPDGWACILQECPECLRLSQGMAKIKSPIDYDYNEVINIRRAFVAPPGWSFFGIDYGAIELRMVANMSKEQLWIDGFVGGKDLHASMAAAVFKDKFALANAAERSYLRSMAKTITFGNLYGGTPRTIQQNLSEPISIDEARILYTNWISAIPGYAAWVRGQKNFVHTYLCTVTMFNRRRSLVRDLTCGDHAKESYAERTALNHPSQGTAADILRISLVRIQEWIIKNNLQDYVKIHFHVHDEINLSCKDEWVPYIIPNIIRMMKVPDIISWLGWPVPLDCDVEYAKSWDVKHNFGKKDTCWKGIPSLSGLNQEVFQKLYKLIVDGTEVDVEHYRTHILSEIYAHWRVTGYQDPYEPFAAKRASRAQAFEKFLETSSKWPTLEELDQISIVAS